ncbi:D-alanyl-D-alanine carboxypeptidase [uncultured Pseudoteredinibacter sp.]|uniref:D-alanyl-D-alanine carboxypeptidase n=1 Tax=uncultured Pseudoteredinibacter sp. TaxID=1641701 RepID=UPI002626302A|nr:D-alanyl-D-alanine carboxypeptidase [uncultured Pseudoteredinibacter sp.]
MFLAISRMGHLVGSGLFTRDIIKRDILNKVFLISIAATLMPAVAQAKPLADYLKEVKAMPEASLLTAKGGGAVDIRSDKPLIPASTMKLLVAYLALEHWGEDHRLSTDFYLQGDTLWVKGLGDPNLTSEELELVALALDKTIDLTKVKKLAVDHSFFPEIRLDGRGKSNNPYDAANSALGVNYNTVYLKRDRRGLYSGEAQTPMTPMAKKLGRWVKGSYRMSLPGGRDKAAQYFAQVFSQIVFAKQLPLEIAVVPATADKIYTHKNSLTIARVVEQLLEYSNNYTTNQLFLLLGAEANGGVVSEQAAIDYASKTFREKFGWQDFTIYDGAGLSRNNRLSTKQLLSVAEALRPWRWLLPSARDHIRAKTGTMLRISSLAGFYRDSEDKWRAFALMINDQDVTFDYRFRLSEQLGR